MALRRESTALPMLDDGESSNTKLGPSSTGVERRHALLEATVVIGNIAEEGSKHEHAGER